MNTKLKGIPFSILLASRTVTLEGHDILNSEPESFSDGILLLSSDFIVQYVNSFALELLGLKNGDLIGKTFEIPGFEKNANLLHNVNIENSQRIIEFRTSNITLNKDSFMLVILQDVTRHFERMERLNLAIEATQLGLWDHNFITNSTSVNS